MEAPSIGFSIVFLLPDWLKLNHLKSPMECAFSDIFFAPYFFHRSRHNRRDKLRSMFWREKNFQKATFEADEIMLGPWNQQYSAEEKLVRRNDFLSRFQAEGE